MILYQEMIDTAIANGTPVVLSPGVWNVLSTLKINQCCGLKIQGAGSFDPTNSGGWSDLSRAIGTKIQWDGADQPLFDLTSSMGVEFSNCVLDGSGKATIGLGCWSVNGWPNSATRMHNVRMQNFTEAAVQFGTPSNPTGGNCDLSYFNGVTLSGCPVGIQVCNDQSVGHVWKRIYNKTARSRCSSSRAVVSQLTVARRTGIRLEIPSCRSAMPLVSAITQYSLCVACMLNQACFWMLPPAANGVAWGSCLIAAPRLLDRRLQ